jgi:hypothetical protein
LGGAQAFGKGENAERFNGGRGRMHLQLQAHQSQE